MTDIKKVIANIDCLFPADSGFTNTAEKGKELLEEAIKNTGFNWRDLPENVLVEYERLCIQENTYQERKMISQKYFDSLHLLDKF